MVDHSSLRTLVQITVYCCRLPSAKLTERMSCRLRVGAMTSRLSLSNTTALVMRVIALYTSLRYSSWHNHTDT